MKLKVFYIWTTILLTQATVGFATNRISVSLLAGVCSFSFLRAVEEIIKERR